MRLGDIAREVKETERNPLNAGIDRFVGLEHLVPEELKISRWGYVADGTTFTKKFKAGQILFGRRRAYQKKAALADFNGICSGDITVIEVIPNKIVPELLPYIIQNDSFFEYAVNESAGSLSPRAKWKHLAEYEVTLPDMDSQSEIAELMMAFDKSMYALQNGIATAVMDLKTRLNEKFNQEPNRTERFGDIFLFEPKSKMPASSGKDRGRYKFFNCSPIQEKFIDDYCYEGEYLILGSGGVPSIHYANERFSSSTDCFVIGCNRKNLCKYVFYFIKNSIEFLADGFRGMALKHISKDYVSDIKIPIFKDESMNEIVKTFDLLEEILRGTNSKIEETKELKKEVFSKILNGGDHR